MSTKIEKIPQLNISFETAMAAISNIIPEILKRKALPAPKLLPSEWEVIEKLLQGHHETRHGKEVFFEDGFSWLQWSDNPQYFRSTGWEYEENEIFRNIRDLDVDDSLVRDYLQSIENPKEYYEYNPKYPWYTIKEFVQDGIIELQFLFSKAAFKH